MIKDGNHMFLVTKYIIAIINVYSGKDANSLSNMGRVMK